MATPLKSIDAKLESTPTPSSIERVEAWSISQTADLLASTHLNTPTPATPTPRTIKVRLDIPLDHPDPEPSPSTLQIRSATASPRYTREPVHVVSGRRRPIRRDSLERREALLKGKEGSRQRRRWENDRLLSNPWAEPPLPSDWEVRPTHPVQKVPYFLAPLWDAEYAKQRAQRQEREEERRQPGSKAEAEAVRVQQELRATLKKARGAKGLLRDLEGEVRGFVKQWEGKQKQLEQEGLIEADSEDEEIVFVGRNGAMSDETRQNKQDAVLAKDKLIFQSLVDDHGAAFGRYLVHSIAQYYGLKTWSVTRGQPARREAYVGVKTDPKTRRPSLRSEMPRPLWTVV